MKITGTFLDEISHDIPHQNWGVKEWDKDFQAMKAFGIKTVILIRCGHKRWMTFPSNIIMNEKQGYKPPVDLLQMFLKLAEKYEMDFYCGTYDSGHYPWQDDYQVEPEVAFIRKVCDEIIDCYGDSPAFKGWYLSHEIAGKSPAATETYRELGLHLKQRMPNTKIMISPGMLGAKAYNEKMEKLGVTIDPALHEAMWRENMEIYIRLQRENKQSCRKQNCEKGKKKHQPHG